MTHDNDTNETFTRTAPPLNRFTVKLGSPAPWDVLTAMTARNIADLLADSGRDMSAWYLRSYADAVDAMTPGYPERDMVTTVEELEY